MASTLPSELKAALDRATFGVSRNDAARRAAAISERYRSGGGSQSIKDKDDALAYALTRMPATYAAIAASLEAVCEALPSFSPGSSLDLGAGPGTASWAAAQMFSRLKNFSLIDANAALREMALQLTSQSAFADFDYRLGDAAIELQGVPAADLVIAGYFAAELSGEGRQNMFAHAWEKTAGILLIVEPGTPDGYRRVLEIRDALIACGAHVVAPCPHDNACPLVAPDWCHFSQRLERSRDHIQAKRADAPFEDEKFSYVALARQPPARRLAPILAPPQMSKAGITFKLCGPGGVSNSTTPRRDKAAYAQARRLRWGDVMPDKIPD
jgi:ribosomal protein RSM22 (predicted rRNA methylase)